MIRKLTVTNYLDESIELNLRNPESSGFLITSIQGLGPVKANINTTEVSTNDGAIYNSARLTKRNVVLSIIFLWKNTIEEARQASYKYFPIKKNVHLVVETDNRIAETEGFVESNDPNIFSNREGTIISIICPDPFLYSVGPNGTNTTIFHGIEPLFEFPFENESLSEPLLEIGAIHSNTTQTVVYNGDSEIGINIIMHAIGNVGDITIYNTRTRGQMKIDTTKLLALTGSGIVSGDEITICTVKGKKSITLLRAGTNINILNCLDRNVDWFQLSKGDNIFAYTATTGSTNLQFRIENKVIYEGV